MTLIPNNAMATRSTIMKIKLAVDVTYHQGTARAAGVLFESWADPHPLETLVLELPKVSNYIPGKFYLRELPCLLALVERLAYLPEFVLVDGYVWLTEKRLPGLGQHLYERLEGQVKVIGVAKSPFRNTPAPILLRGKSKRPLYITAAGLSDELAKGLISSMHGEHRIPTLLKLAHTLSKRQ